MPYDALLRGRHSQLGQAYFVTTTLAVRKQAIFEDLDCARLVISQMRTLHEEQAVRSLAFVAMPDHVHWLFHLGNQLDLTGVIKRFKARSAQTVNAHMDRKGRLWQRGYHEHAVRVDENIRHVARYIVANPLRAGLVTRVGGYPHWDAAWLDDLERSEIAVWSG